MDKRACTFTIAELVASYMINNNTQTVTINQLKNYFIVLKSMCDKNKNVVLKINFSNKFLNEFKDYYSDLFDLNAEVINLKSGVSLDDLRTNILAYIPHYQLVLLLDTLPKNNSISEIKTI